jgi:hypothetical protein
VPETTSGQDGDDAAGALQVMTGTHNVYRTVAREPCSSVRTVSVFAPDLRGRGRTAHLPLLPLGRFDVGHTR